MKKNIRFCMSVIVLFLAGNVFSQDEVPVSVPKIAILDMAAALYNSDLASAVQDQLSFETGDDSERIRELAQEGSALQERLTIDAEVLSEAEQREILEELEEIGVQYQFLEQRVESIVEQRREIFEQTYSSNLIQAISDVVEEEDYDAVLRAEVALFFKRSLDITAKVTEKLNEQQ
ncbi:MAG: OmpH family outer membrane protein [Pseudohongiellaceae bacterium]